MRDASQISVSLTPVDDFAALACLWTDLQQRSRPSFFTSWGWIGCWLKCLPSNVHAQVLTATVNGVVVGLAIVCERSQRRRKLLVSEGLFLNETGDESLDELTIEHNGILADSTCEAEVDRACLDFLLAQRSDWDELFFSGIDDTNRLSPVLRTPPAGIDVRLFKEAACATVNLAAIRQSGGDYLAKLSSNSRQQVRRAMRQCEQSGPLTVETPRTLSEAEQFFDELKCLHQAYWQGKGKPGAFGSDFCDCFHRTLIAERWPEGEIQLLKVRAGDHLLGYLYNFVFAGRVLSYQSGFAYEENPKRKPGIVTDVLAVQHNLERGAAVFDFLAGNERYKQSLATDSSTMRWFVWQRPRWRLRVESWLRNARRKLIHLSQLTPT